MGARLVVRSHRFLSLTPEGEKLLVWGRQVLANCSSLREDLTGSWRGLTGTLRLGVIPAAMPWVAFVSADFSAQPPAAKIESKSLTSRAIERALDSFEIDGGMTYLDNEPLENVRRVPLYRERYVFVVRRDHPRAESDTSTWRKAAAEHLCLLGWDMQNRRIIDKLASSIGVVIDPMTSDSSLALCSHPSHGGWAGIMPHTFLSVFGGASQLRTIDLVDPVHTQAVGPVPSNRPPLSPMAGALLGIATSVDFDTELRAPATVC